MFGIKITYHSYYFSFMAFLLCVQVFSCQINYLLQEQNTTHHSSTGLPCKNWTLVNGNIVSGHTEILQNFHVAKLIFLIFLIDSFCLPVQISVEPPLPYLDCQLLESCNRPAPGGSCLCSGSISTVYSRSPPRCTAYRQYSHTHT